MAKFTEIFPFYHPISIARMYGFPLTQTGKDQSIAIISLGGQLNLDDLKKDFSTLRVPYPDIQVVNVDEIPDKQNSKYPVETHLDVEVIGSICSDATITIYRGNNSNGFAPAVKRAIDDDNDVISISWGNTEDHGDKKSEMERVLRQAAHKRITVCVATGDGGSSNYRNQQTGAAIPAPDGHAHVQYPASSPWVLACGGTELVTMNHKHYEAVWNNSSIGGGAGGGGVSNVFPRPAYQLQAGIDIKSINDGKSMRVVPDVAGLAADGDWVIAEGGKSTPIGGTSAVAPLWASLIALVNEQRAAAGKVRLGFINKRLYELGAKGLMSDVLLGNNRSGPHYPGYDATPGFDACTGWGTPTAELAKALFELDDK